MNIGNCIKAIQFKTLFTLRSNLLLMTGQPNEVVDNTIDTTPDGRLHINGYVWSGLLRRALQRIEDGDALAERIGKYNSKNGVSPLWMEATIADIQIMGHRTGNAVSRKWKSTKPGALFSSETVPPGIHLPMKFNFFLNQKDDPDKIIRLFQDALWVINEGIENIGGGWSYGFGRLKFENGACDILDLTEKTDREKLFSFASSASGLEMKIHPDTPKIIKPWKKLLIKSSVVDGQLLAIHTGAPLIDTVIGGKKLPDNFVFRRYIIDSAHPDGSTPQIVITGKSIRQALFSREIERRLKTEGETICYEADGETTSGDCACLRCQWFGSTSRAGILAVLDAPVEDAETDIIKRVQLCEHSMQNIQLFSGEYLKKGNFFIEVLVDESREKESEKRLMDYLETLLKDLMPAGPENPASKPNAPPGWYRIGATSSCTGQIAVSGWESVSYEGGVANG